MPKFAGVIGAGALAFFVAAGASAQAERLTLGVFPGLDAAESFEILDRYMPLAQYLQAKSGAVVMLVPVRVPGAAIQRMIEDGKSYKLFFGPPVFAAEAIKKADFVTLAMEREKISGVFLVKTRSKLQTVRDVTPSTHVAMPSPKLLLAILALATLGQEKIVLQPDARRHLDSAEGMLLALDNGVVDGRAVRIDGDGDRHVFHLELVDRFHAEIAEGEHSGFSDRLGDEIGGAAHGDQRGGLVPADRLERRGAAFAFADHGEETGLPEHRLGELVHARRRRGARRADDLVAHRIDRADVVDHAIAEVHREFFTVGEHVGDALVRGLAAGEHFPRQEQRFAGLPPNDFRARDRVEVYAPGLRGGSPGHVRPVLQARRLELPWPGAVGREV